MNRLSSRQSAAAVERLRDATQVRGLDDHPDAELLDRFARYADHPAFESLLRRHGPMVLGVCRRLLANPADVDDAFQATFLVLVRKARSVRRGDRLGPWLYGVAFRVATKARARSARTASRHTETTDMLPDPTSPSEVPDWLPVLDAELNALPAKYREPLVLCELQGATRADAAKALGIPEGTLSSRLARGRELLRRRLLKHGTLLPAGGLAALFSAHGVGRAAVPLALLAKTSELAVATGAGLAGAVPAGAARLTDEVLKGMFLTKLRTAAVAVVATVLVATGVTGAMSGGVPGQEGKPAAGASRPGGAGRGSDAAGAKKDPQGGRAAGDGSVGYVQPGPGRNPEDHGGQYKALFARALGVLAEDFEQISEADQYSGRIEARQPLTNRVVAVEIRRSDDGRLAVGVRVSREAAGQKHRDADLERAILQRLNAQADEQPEKPKTASTAAKTAPPKPDTPPADPNRFRGAGQELRVESVGGVIVLPDRDALQGLWVLEKVDIGVQGQGAQNMIGKMQFLVAGNVWWGMLPNSGEGVAPTWAAIDPAKNPKWLDLTGLTLQGPDTTKCIYELSGDKLRVCMSEGTDAVRPAEFAADLESHVTVMEFTRGKLPPAVGEKALVGSWIDGDGNAGRRPAGSPPPRRIEILDGYLFAFTGEGKWIGGKYTVDTTKNPKWIDVELVGVGDDEKVKNLYGTYEVGADGRLKVAFGTSGRRTVRPLELQPARGVMYFDLAPTKEPPTAVEKVVREEIPAPRPKPVDLPRPKTDTPESEADAQIRKWMKEGDFARAEDRLRVVLAQSAGLRAAELRLLLAVCLIERAKEFGEGGAATLRSQAQGNLSLALKELDSEPRADDKRAAWVRTQCDIRSLQILHQQGKAKEVLAAAEELRPKHAGTAEELVILSFAYHAHRQRGQSDDADLTRERMRVLFAKLKEKPDAFPEKTGEFSREYWEKAWFGEGK